MPLAKVGTRRAVLRHVTVAIPSLKPSGQQTYLPMIREYSRKSLAIGIPAIALLSVPVLVWGNAGIMSSNTWVTTASVVLPIAGSALFIVALCYYAKAKGYNGALGLLGMLSCVGLLIIALLPDRTKK